MRLRDRLRDLWDRFADNPSRDGEPFHVYQELTAFTHDRRTFQCTEYSSDGWMGIYESTRRTILTLNRKGLFARDKNDANVWYPPHRILRVVTAPAQEGERFCTWSEIGSDNGSERS